MSVIELRCTSCAAPIDPSRGPVQRCVYCGAMLVVGADFSVSPAGLRTLRLEDCGPNRIQVIKVIREYTGLGLKEAKELSESAPCALGESLDPARLGRFRADLEAAHARVSGSAEPPTGFSPEPGLLATAGGSVRVVIEECGPNQIAVIKVIREYTGLGLKEAKDLSGAAPCVLAESIDPVRAWKFCAALVAAGARAR